MKLQYEPLTSCRIYSSNIISNTEQLPPSVHLSLFDHHLRQLQLHPHQYHPEADAPLRHLSFAHRHNNNHNNSNHHDHSSTLLMNRRPVELCSVHQNCYLHHIIPGLAPIHLSFIVEHTITTELIQLLQQFQLQPEDQLHIEVDVIPRSSNTSSVVYWKNGVRHFPPPIINTHHLRHLPFAPVTAPLFDWDAFESWWDVLAPHEDLSTMVAWLSRPNALAKRLAPYISLVHQDSSTTLTRNDQIQFADLSSFLQQGTIVHNEDGNNTVSAIIFKVLKSGGENCRMIWDGSTFGLLMEHYFRGQRERDISNNIFKPSSAYEIPKTPLPLIPTLVNEILNPKWKYMSTVDAKNMFYQFKIRSKDLSKLFGIRYQFSNNKIIHLLLACLPQGINFSPSFAQHTSLYICRIVKYVVTTRCKELNIPDKDFHLTAWIDNFILLTLTLEDRIFISKIFDEVVGTENILINNQHIGSGVNLQMKPWEHQDEQGIITVLGIKFNLVTKEAAPAEDKRSEVNQLMNNFRDQSTTTNRIFFQWFGLCQWMVYSTAQLPLCFF